jgi:hypothetical protein
MQKNERAIRDQDVGDGAGLAAYRGDASYNFIAYVVSS